MKGKNLSLSMIVSQLPHQTCDITLDQNDKIERKKYTLKRYYDNKYSNSSKKITKNFSYKGIKNNDNESLASFGDNEDSEKTVKEAQNMTYFMYNYTKRKYASIAAANERKNIQSDDFDEEHESVQKSKNIVKQNPRKFLGKTFFKAASNFALSSNNH